MRPWKMSVVLSSLVTLAIPMSWAEESKDPADAEVRSAIDGFFTALKKGDLDAVKAHLAEEDRAEFKSEEGEALPEFEFEIGEIEIEGDRARAKVTFRSGEDSSQDTIVLVREDEAWKVSFIETTIEKQGMHPKTYAARAYVRMIASCVDLYVAQNSRLPESLGALVEAQMLEEDLLQDPWGRPYLYERGEKLDFAIRSLGADGVAGGERQNTDVSSADRDTEDGDTEDGGSSEPGKGPSGESDPVAVAEWKIERLEDAIRAFTEDQGYQPERLDELYTKPDGAQKWPEGGYLETGREGTIDPWGNPIEYSAGRSANSWVNLTSYGADGKPDDNPGVKGEDRDLYGGWK